MSKTKTHTWERSFIKCDPVVEREVKGRHGEVMRERNVEEMIRVFKKRVAKSEVLDEYKKRRYFEKPSTTKRRKRNDIKYENSKRTQKEKEAHRLRTTGK